jgi:hypothetical protein
MSPSAGCHAHRTVLPLKHVRNTMCQREASTSLLQETRMCRGHLRRSAACGQVTTARRTRHHGPLATSFRSPGCTASSAPRLTCFARSRLLPFTLYALRATVGQSAHLLHTSAHHEASAGRAWNSWLQIPIEAAPACISRTSTCMVQVPQHSQFRRAMLATECGRETRAHTCRCCSCAHVQLCQAPTISNTMWLHLQLAVPYPTPRTMFQMTGCSPGQRRHARDRHVCSLYTASAGLNHLQLLPCRH